MPKGSRASADAAAARAFSRLPELPVDQDTIANARALEGRQRLTGAFLIETSRIRPDPKQPRKTFTDKDRWEIAASIEKLGILQPITVQYIESENVYQIITGERRYQAIVSLNIPAIPCWVRTPDSQTTLVHQIVENWQREDLDPYDLSDALKELRDVHGLSQQEIAQLTGKAKSEISRYLAMQRVDPAAQAQIRTDESGQFSRRHVVAVSQLDASEQPAFVEKIKTENLTAEQTEREVRWRLGRNADQSERRTPVVVRRYAIGPTRVQITFRKQHVTDADVLQVLDRVRAMVENEPGNTRSE